MSRTPLNTVALQDDGEPIGRLRGRDAIAGVLLGVSLLAGSVEGAATVTPKLSGVASLSAGVAGDATLAGTLTDFPVVPGEEMQAAVTGTADVSGTLLLPGGLGGSLPGAATLDGTLQPFPRFFASVSGDAQLTGTLTESFGLAASVAGTATLEGSLSTALSLQGILAGSSTAILEAPSTFSPRFEMTKDLSPLFQLNEFAFETTWNDNVTFQAILTDFYGEIIGGTVNLAGTDPIMIAEHSDIAQVKEGDSIKIQDFEWVVREVQPSNTGLVRLTLELV